MNRRSGRALALLLLAALLPLAGCHKRLPPEDPNAPKPTTEAGLRNQGMYRELLPLVSVARLRETYARVAALGPSRLSGTPAEAATFDLAERELRALGATNVVRTPFDVTLPDPAARGDLALPGGRSVALFPMWPNLVRTATCDVSGPLLYAGRGTLEELKGLPINGAIVVMEFDSAARWRNAAKLGARAAIFLPPDDPDRAEAEAKFAAVPLAFPRFYLPLKTAAPVLAAARARATVSLKCRQDWKRSKSAILSADLPGSDPAERDRPVALYASVDALSVVPGLAPGAEASGNLAALLETARVYAKRPHRRPLRLIVAGGHAQALQGAREWTDALLRANGAGTPLLTLTLDLASGSPTVGAYGRGWFYEYRDELLWAAQPVTNTFRAHAEDLAKVLGVAPPRLVLIDAANNGDGRIWKNNIPGKFALDCEPMTLAGLNAITFATVEDSRPRVDTPFDTADRVDYGNVRRQTQTLVCMMAHALDDTTVRGADTPNKIMVDDVEPTRMRLIGGFSTVSGQVVRFDANRSFVPDTPVSDTLACQLGRQKTLMGVRGDVVQATLGPKAEYRLLGAAPVNSYPANDPPWIRLTGFRLDPKTGNVDHAASLGTYGDEKYPLEYPLKVTERVSTIVVFPCVGIDLYDLVDPQELKAIPRIRVLDARSGTNPQDYGLFSPGYDQRLSPDIEDAQVLYLPPDLRFLLLGGMGENRLVLTNSTVGDETGKGYRAPSARGRGTGDGGQGTSAPSSLVPRPSSLPDRSDIARSGLFPQTALNVAEDLTAINQTRLDRFYKYRIISPGVKTLQEDAQREIVAAREGYAKADWGEADRHARAAWGYALRAHPVIQTTANDVVNGVVFYLFLLIPFSYFLERMTFGHQLLTKQLLTSVGYFIASFVLLRLIHPAFEIVQNPAMIFVAFVMGVLALVVISFILGKFESQLRAVKAEQVGIHEVDIRRGSVALAAFNLGVSNMRRRKARTFLTTLTLVVMTFIVLSFTSVVADLALNEQPSPNSAAYSGLLVRTPDLAPLQATTYRQVANEFSGRGTVARRAYYYGADVGDNSVLTLQRADRVAEVRAMVGLEPNETEVTRPQQALLPGGRWFRPGDRNVMILPTPLAETLKVDPSEVGKVAVQYAGVPYTVIGLVDPSILRGISDLDGDGILPPDFSLSRRYQEQTASTNQAFRSYLRLDPASCFFLPAETALSLGADMRSLAVRFADPKDTRKALDSLMPRLRLNLYASVPGADGKGLEVRQFSVFQSSKSTGLGLIVVQMLIAGSFVLSTMVATVYERTKEISIFSAIGLAPNHIAMLFFAESLVYGVMGAVIGYFAAQGTAKFIIATGALPALTLNFSSTSAVLSAVLVMAVVLLSTIYPARKASQIAAPAMNEEVFETEPEGDEWNLPLPFSISEKEAGPVMAFLGEWLKAYEGYTIGEFVTQDAAFGRAPSEDGARPSYAVSAMLWLAPYDLGVSQTMRLVASPSRVAGVYVLDLTLRRVSGDPENWPTANQRFLAAVRRQFLTWRTLPAEVRAKYAAEMAEATEEPVAA